MSKVKQLLLTRSCVLVCLCLRVHVSVCPSLCITMTSQEKYILVQYVQYGAQNK